MNFYEDGMNVLKSLDQYRTQCWAKEQRVILQQSIQAIHDQLDLSSLIEKGGLSGKKLSEFLNTYLENTTRLHHPGYMAHQVGIPNSNSALASLIDGFTNNPMAIYEMGPAAAAIEFFMINYLLGKVGWEPMPTDIDQRLTFAHSGGVMTNGGSIANLTALLTARNHLDNTIREKGNPGDLVILAPKTSHYSVVKAAGIIGIGENNVIGLETDHRGRVITQKMEKAYKIAREQNKRIVALVANGCSTGTGIYDPIDEIADFCSEKKIWFHVDGAHGGGALFSRKYCSLLNGLKKADSFIIDAHKMLRTPAVCACLMVKDCYALDHTFEHKASYLFHEKKQPGFDFIAQVIECTKAGIGLKFFMAIAQMGEKGLESYIDKTYDVTKSAYAYIEAQSDFEVPVFPESNILCFRFNAPDDLQLKIRDYLIEKGTFHISSTELNTKRYLRIVVINPKTKQEDIEELIKGIRAAVINNFP